MALNLNNVQKITGGIGANAPSGYSMNCGADTETYIIANDATYFEELRKVTNLKNGDFFYIHGDTFAGIFSISINSNSELSITKLTS